MYYIWHKPSYFGMGSNTDVYLISDMDLKTIVSVELQKHLNGNRSGLPELLGVDSSDKLCVCNDIDTVYEDVIKKHTSSVTTYAGVKDLIPLEADVTITTKQYGRQIFRVFNQRGYKRDIITSGSIFTLYDVDFRSNKAAKLYDDEFKRYGRFCNYEMSNVLENHYSSTIESELLMNYNRASRMKAKLDGTARPPVVDGEKYIDDILETTDTDWYKGLYDESIYYINKFSSLPEFKDDYVQYLSSEITSKYSKILYDYSYIEDETEEHTKYIFQRPLMPYSLGVVCEKECDGYCHYGELFNTGLDTKYLPASLLKVWGKKPLSETSVLPSLLDVFGYE